jgi:hypothetical protein
VQLHVPADLPQGKTLLQSMPPVMATQHLLTLAVVKDQFRFLDWDIYWADSDNMNGKIMASRQYLHHDFYCLGVAHLNLLVLHGWWPDINLG